LTHADNSATEAAEATKALAEKEEELAAVMEQLAASQAGAYTRPLRSST